MKMLNMKFTTLLKTIAFGLLFSFGISTVSLYADDVVETEIATEETDENNDQ